MSEENVDAIRSALDAFARADVEGFLPFMDKEIHFEPNLAGVEGSYVGHDGVKRFFDDAFGTFEIEEATYPDTATSETRCSSWGRFA